MEQPSGYAVVRVHDDSYRLDRTTPPGAGAVAFVLRFRDRLGNPLGWRLRPLVVMQGAKSRICPTPAEALASPETRGDELHRPPAGRACRCTGGGSGEDRDRPRTRAFSA